jgi:hypothetical protein
MDPDFRTSQFIDQLLNKKHENYNVFSNHDLTFGTPERNERKSTS